MTTTLPGAPADTAPSQQPGTQGTPGPGAPGGYQFDPPFVLPETVELREGIVYANPGGEALRLDLFLPRRRQAGVTQPGLVFVHGGGWRAGTRRQFWRHAARMAERGWPGVSVQYRFTPAHRFPAQLEDVQAGVRWLRRHAAEYGIDPEWIGAAGGSAGGHLAALLGTTDAVVDGVPSRVQAVVAFNGVFDFPTLTTEQATGPRRDFVGDDAETARLASPLHRADERAAPALLLHGTADTTVPFAQSAAFEERLRALGVRTELYAAEGAAHGFFNRPPHYQPALEHMERFFVDVLGR